VRSLGAPNVSKRTDAELIQSFVDRIAEYRPHLLTFEGSSFDLPLLRYRAMINRASAPGLHVRNYWNRYTEDALDLCDALASFASNGKTSLNDLGRALGFTGKPDGMVVVRLNGLFARDGSQKPRPSSRSPSRER
jgi:predicted PolB exonuclease-like 3'-5' exonuclease